MMAMTTSSSINVKPACCRRGVREVEIVIRVTFVF